MDQWLWWEAERKQQIRSHIHECSVQRRKVPEYIYSSIALNLSISILMQLLTSTPLQPEANIVLYAPLHLFDNLVTSYFADVV